ncbi:uncharacterized protein LOC106176510 isoform X2 [Lingula anatina]|uniref:Uncharacterized protein LOC106176510 isoform X2 n=1 Tax=Lingula anatina TaxID=7574 RepID=A0A1S3JVJ2_LINAN|nr:uncharacterized protein LOC106176510 isoform X2 [Lingula anatina]|eukprot:XP_013414388.1 uncharacterized protein LOC106176510 isoform X2 [Lingula anatina]
MPKLGRRSDIPDVQYAISKNVTTTNAPFGTTDSPNVRVKIVGGKTVMVLDDTGKTSPKSGSALAPITEKPNHFDPKVLTNADRNTSQWGFSSAQKDIHNSHFHKVSQGRGPLNPHTILPPIHNSQHFRSESTQTDVEEGTQTDFDDNNDKDMFQKHLGYGGNMPSHAVRLTKQEELTLLNQINEGLGRYDPQLMRDLYLELTGYDKHLTGWILFEDLQHSLSKMQVYLPPQTVRLAASLFVSPDHPGQVNYEKFLSYIGSATKDYRSQLQSGQPKTEPPKKVSNVSPQTYHKGDGRVAYSDKLNSPRSVAETSPNVDQRITYYRYPGTQPTSEGNSPREPDWVYEDNAKLLRIIEDTFLQSKDEIDLEKMRSLFAKADRERRGTLSRDQIKDICVYSSLPLQGSILDRVVDKCKGMHGQYHWEQFLEYLERVQPLHTGLPIPDSKKPLEYAKQILEPTESWPRKPTESPVQVSPRGIDPGRGAYGAPSTSGQQMKYNTVDPNDQMHLRHSRMDKLDHLDSRFKEQTRSDSIEHQLKELEDNYQYARRRLEEERRHETEPWFQRFMKLANALYESDTDHSGALPEDEVERLCNMYNDAYYLDIPENEIRKAVRHSSSDRGLVYIDPLLQKLGLQK